MKKGLDEFGARQLTQAFHAIANKTGVYTCNYIPQEDVYRFPEMAMAMLGQSFLLPISEQNWAGVEWGRLNHYIQWVIQNCTGRFTIDIEVDGYLDEREQSVDPTAVSCFLRFESKHDAAAFKMAHEGENTINIDRPF